MTQQPVADRLPRAPRNRAVARVAELGPEPVVRDQPLDSGSQAVAVDVVQQPGDVVPHQV